MPNIRKKFKKQSMDEVALGEQMEGMGMPGSLGLLRNVARLNRPDMSQLDREYRMRTEGFIKASARPGDPLAASPVADHILSTNKSTN